MENVTRVKMEFEIQAQKIISQVQLNNESIEDQLKKGVEKAFEEMFKNDNFIDYVASATKEAVNKAVENVVDRWSFAYDLQKLVTDKIQKKVNEYAEKMAKELFDKLEAK